MLSRFVYRKRVLTLMIAYVRVSRESGDDGPEVEQAGILAQRRVIENAARWGGFTVDRFVVEIVSGRTLRRPGLQSALADCAVGVAGGIVVAKLDRLSRSVIDFASLLERAKKENWNIMALDFGLDMSTPQGELVANVLMSVAQWERRIIGQRTKEALAERKAAGVVLGRRPTIPNSTRRDARALLLEGFSPRAVAAEIQRRGLQMSYASVQRLRQKMVEAGEISKDRVNAP